MFEKFNKRSSWNLKIEVWNLLFRNYTEKIVEAIKNLLKIPTDKTFESASLYSGNLTILSSKMLFSKTNYTILQDAVLKIFRSRTPSVIQSLVLIYSTIINSNTAT